MANVYSSAGEVTTRKPYEGLQPGTEAWILCWVRHPWLRKEMLRYHLQWELENYYREHKLGRR